MSDFENLFIQLKQLSVVITEENYNDYFNVGYDILIRIHDLGITKEQAYSILLKYYNSLEDGLSKEWFADLLDCICGWCDPIKYIWKEP